MSIVERKKQLKYHDNSAVCEYIRLSVKNHFIDINPQASHAAAVL
jgi:hypothetical protein